MGKSLYNAKRIYLYGCSDVGNRGKGRRKQGESAKVTGSKPVIGSERGNNQQRPLLISAAGGDEVGSVRCVPSFILME